VRVWLLGALLVVGVLCAGAGVALSGNPFAAARFEWTAYAPLSSAHPIDLTWLIWAPRIGLALVAIGAGTSGAALAALVLRRLGGRRDAHEAPAPDGAPGEELAR
jgi:heme/copper-type cytochrome/quinol oxidase subunit 1